MSTSLTRPHRQDDFHARLRAARSRDVHDDQEQPARPVIPPITPKQDALLMLAAVGVVALLYVAIWLLDIAASVPA